MPGLMIMLALVLAPAVDPELKDPWSAASRAGATKSDLLDPFAPRASGDAAASEPSAGKASADLRDPFEAASPLIDEANGPLPTATQSSDLRNPFEARNPPRKAAHASELVDPFQVQATTHVEPSGRARADALELRNPFSPRPSSGSAAPPPRPQVKSPLRRRAARSR